MKKVIYFLFFCAVFTMSMIKLTLLRVQAFELTVSDFLILICFISIVFFNTPKIKIFENLKIVLIAFGCFLYAMLFSGVKAVNYMKFSLAFLPLVYAFIIIIVTTSVLGSFKSPKPYKVLLLSVYAPLVISYLYVYLPFLNLIPIPSNLYSGHNWRYQFLTQNPNQYAVYMILSSFSITLISMRYVKEWEKYSNLITIFGVLPMLSSGSRTGFIGLLVTIIFLNFYKFLGLGLKAKVFAGLITFIVLTAFGFSFSNYLFSLEGGQIQRALTAFDMLSSGSGLDPHSMGPSGLTILKGVQKFIENPVFGIGFANFTEYNPHEIHNTPISILAETGVVGLVALVVFYFSFIYVILKSNLPTIHKWLALLFLALFIGMNYPHYLFRERWVWFFFSIIIMSFKSDKVKIRPVFL